MSNLPEPSARSSARKFFEGAGRTFTALVRGLSALTVRLFNLVLGPNTFLGRWVRRSLRTLAAIVIFFITGFLLVYLLLYQPAVQQLNETKAGLEAAKTRLTEIENLANTMAAQLTTAESRGRQLGQALESVEVRVAYYAVTSRVWAAHSFLLEEDLAAAQTHLAEIEADWPTLVAAVEKQDPNLARTMQQRLELVLGELKRSPESARADLKILIARLAEAEKLLPRN